jgi:hypothetical protein
VEDDSIQLRVCNFQTRQNVNQWLFTPARTYWSQLLERFFYGFTALFDVFDLAEGIFRISQKEECDTARDASTRHFSGRSDFGSEAGEMIGARSQEITCVSGLLFPAGRFALSRQESTYCRWR